jgi:hypothetical protein
VKTFIHRFGPKLSCRLEIDDQPVNGMISMPTVCWKGRPRKKHIRPYIMWMHVVCQQCALEWGVELTRCYRTPQKTWEHWRYVPGDPAKLDYVSEAGPCEPFGQVNHCGVFDSVTE